MRTLAVLALFVASLLGLGATLSAEANSRISIEPGLSPPVEMDDGALAGRKHKDGGRDDEESEEDLIPSAADQRQALELLDPADLDTYYKLKLATRR